MPIISLSLKSPNNTERARKPNSFVTALSLYRAYILVKCSAVLKQLQPVQNTLGLYNDLFIAEDLFNKTIEHDPHFWFALGWVKAKQPYLQNQSAEALQKFKQAKTFW